MLLGENNAALENYYHRNKRGVNPIITNSTFLSSTIYNFISRTGKI